MSLGRRSAAQDRPPARRRWPRAGAVYVAGSYPMPRVGRTLAMASGRALLFPPVFYRSSDLGGTVPVSLSVSVQRHRDHLH
jgi:hypothetical protein